MASLLIIIQYVLRARLEAVGEGLCFCGEERGSSNDLFSSKLRQIVLKAVGCSQKGQFSISAKLSNGLGGCLKGFEGRLMFECIIS